MGSFSSCNGNNYYHFNPCIMSTIYIFQFTDPDTDDRPDDFAPIPREIQDELDELFSYLYPDPE